MTTPGWRVAVAPWKWLPVDASIWCLAVFVAVWMRFDFVTDDVDLVGTAALAAGLTALQALFGAIVGVYLRRFVPGSFEDASAVVWTGVAVTAVAFGLTLSTGPVLVPRSVPAIAGALAILGMLAVRFVGRAWAWSRVLAQPDATPVVVFGAGNAAAQLLRHMGSEKPRRFIAKALLDDDAAKRRLEVAGVPVRGTREDLGRVAERVGATTVVVALPNADSDLMRDISRRAEAAGLRVLVLPPLHQIMHRRVGAGDLREVDVFDLLGRRPVQLEESSIAAGITGRRVLVTGAGGSIGSELCRQIHRFGPSELVMLDRDESALHAVQLSIYGKAMLDDADTVLADIRDPDVMRQVFLRRRPEVVFHAAALKHLPLLERYPDEAWKTNVVGTSHVLDAATDAEVPVFINVSTDKAANPTSILGFSKRVAERLTAATAAGMPTGRGGRYVSVRFGNVLGSRGSVLTAFEQQIRMGGPVTVTDPAVDRFFMTIAEACQLVLQAAAIGEQGEVLVLDMGKPVKIMEVARTLIQRSGRTDVEIQHTGLRAGEKLHEELFGDDEPQDVRPRHPLISHVPVSPLRVLDLSLDRFRDPVAARRWLKEATTALAPPLSAAARDHRASAATSVRADR